MANPFDDMRAAVDAAEMTLRAADSVADDMARLLAGRLRHVTGYHGARALKALKHELRNFDTRTMAWKEPK